MFEIYYSEQKGKFYWRLKSKAGKLMANSSRGYSNKQSIISAVDSVRHICMVNPPDIRWKD